jgi:RHS repeat-associated protein
VIPFQLRPSFRAVAASGACPLVPRFFAAPSVIVAFSAKHDAAFAGIAIFLVPVQAQAQTVPCEDIFYPLSDNLGSVNTLTNHNGSVVLTQHFLPFGEDFESPKPTVTTCNADSPWPYGFTGQYHDAETSLIYFHARYYNPAIGHFMSADSVVPNPNDTYSYDRYAYCRNNPVNLTDPSGHFWNIIIGAIIGGIMAAISGQNILEGMAMGALAGAMFGGIAAAGAGELAGGQLFLATFAAGMITGGMNASMSGGDPLKAMLIGGASAALSQGILGSKWAGKLTTTQKDVVTVLSGGVIGGLSSSAMGGGFWQGFVAGAAVAGISIAANEIAGAIQRHEWINAATKAARGMYPGITPKEAHAIAVQALKDIRTALHNKYRADLKKMPLFDVVPFSSASASWDDPPGTKTIGITPEGFTQGGAFSLFTVNGEVCSITLSPKQYIYSVMIHEYLGHALPNYLTGNSHADAYRHGGVTSLEATHQMMGIYGETQLFPDMLSFDARWATAFMPPLEAGGTMVPFSAAMREYWATVSSIPVGY